MHPTKEPPASDPKPPAVVNSPTQEQACTDLGGTCIDYRSANVATKCAPATNMFVTGLCPTQITQVQCCITRDKFKSYNEANPSKKLTEGEKVTAPPGQPAAPNTIDGLITAISRIDPNTLKKSDITGSTQIKVDVNFDKDKLADRSFFLRAQVVPKTGGTIYYAADSLEKKDKSSLSPIRLNLIPFKDASTWKKGQAVASGVYRVAVYVYPPGTDGKIDTSAPVLHSGASTLYLIAFLSREIPSLQALG